MKINVSIHEAFRAYGREDKFSHDALNVIEEHLEDVGVEDLDVIAICCEYREYDSALEAAEDNGYEPPIIDEDDEDAMDWLSDRTTVIEFSGGVVVVKF